MTMVIVYDAATCAPPVPVYVPEIPMADERYGHTARQTRG